MATFISSRATFILLLFTIIAQPAAAGEKKVLFIAGNPSHGFGNHEHMGGLQLLSETISEAGLNIRTKVIREWPEDTAAFNDVDAVVIFSNGAERHPLMGHLEEFDKIMDRGVGLVTLHFAVEIPPGEPGDKFLKWQGGYFKTHWSVNPFWTARFHKFPDHPVTNGVKPFEVHDEWYYHMRFVNNFHNITPILTDLPPPETLERGDGPHSNNSHVRQAILVRKEPQHLAWTYERPDSGGRAFGFTGGHYHWNWGINEYRRLVSNAIVWVSGAEVPVNGVRFEPISALELSKMTCDPVPNEWNHEEIQRMIDFANND